jgi:hypothetical protein
MKDNLISDDITNLLEIIFNCKIHNDYYEVFDDLDTFFKYDICEFINDYEEISPRDY